jgi:ubiquinone biosynthesis protein COQ4
MFDRMVQRLSRNLVFLNLSGQLTPSMQAFLDLLTADVEDSQPVVELANTLIDSRGYELAAQLMKSDVEVAAVIEERYLAPAHNLDALLQYPEDSLGYVYAKTLKQMDYQPGFYPNIEVNSETSYIEYRWRQTHDIWHIITGFDTSDVGETGLQGFYLAQCHLPFSRLIIASGLIDATLENPEQFSGMLQAIAQGWKMGKQAKSFLAQKWEEAWEKPVWQWRHELNVQSV